MIRRAIGLVLVFVFLLAFEPGNPDLWNRIALPSIACIGAWLIIGHPAAVMLAVAGLATVHSDLGASDPVIARVYPAVAVAASVAVAAILLKRFVDRARGTREERRRAREVRLADACPPAPERR